ncbi:MAG: DDE-type integrase/transposase/recombinase, partial [Nitrospinota bacterium]
MARNTDPYDAAVWRYEQIAPLIDRSLTQIQKTEHLRVLTELPVVWPSGEERPIGRSTVYRWIKAYQDGGLPGLLPKSRSDRQTTKGVSREVLAFSLALLYEEPQRSLYQLGRYIEVRFEGERAPARSTLHRALQAHPAYAGIVKRRKGAKSRKSRKRRFEAAKPHEIWQLDAKIFRIRFASGEEQKAAVLTCLDDKTRAVVAATVSASEDMAAAARVFRRAAARWGLPDRIYCDRHSVYDSNAFRNGLALLGVHRIRTRARNKEARGKIEAYHRPLNRWFVKELRHQAVCDVTHADELLQATI